MKSYSKVFCTFQLEGETVHIGVVTKREVTDFIKSRHASRLWQEATGCANSIVRPLVAVEFREFGDAGVLSNLVGSTHHIEQAHYEPVASRPTPIKASGLHTL